MRNPHRFILPATIAVVLTAAAFFSFARGSEPLAVASAWARATPPGATVGVAYVTIENRSAADDRLVSASTPAAGSVDVHETVEENGVAAMRPLPNPVVPANGKLEMGPGATHLMLMDLTAPLIEGKTFSLTLVFEGAAALTVEVPIAGIGADTPPAGHDHSM